MFVVRVLDVGKGVKPESRARRHGEQTHRSPLVHLGCATTKNTHEMGSFRSSVFTVASSVAHPSHRAFIHSVLGPFARARESATSRARTHRFPPRSTIRRTWIDAA